MVAERGDVRPDDYLDVLVGDRNGRSFGTVWTRHVSARLQLHADHLGNTRHGRAKPLFRKSDRTRNEAVPVAPLWLSTPWLPTQVSIPAYVERVGPAYAEQLFGPNSSSTRSSGGFDAAPRFRSMISS